MEISVSKRTNGHYKENPAIGEIVVEVRQPRQKATRLEVNEEEFEDILEEYVDKAENFGDFDMLIEDRILKYGVKQETFNEMKKELEMQNTNEYMTNSDDDNSFAGFINFPWKEWKERLLTIYTEE